MMQSMKPYSEDLRTRIVRSVEVGATSKFAAACLFGVSLSSVKRYLRLSERGVSLAPREGGVRPLKTSQTTEKLVRDDAKQPGRYCLRKASLPGARTTGKVLSDSTVKRLLKRL